MFVAIDNTEMNVHQVDRWIKDNRDVNRGIITPEFAMEVLSKTNHLANIKMVLKNIRENCDTPEKIAPYREFILSCVDRREMSEQAMDMLQEMAKLCGCKDELETINKKDKMFGMRDCDKAVIVVCTNENFVEDISSYKMVRFEYGDKHGSLYDIRIREGCKLPKVCDFSSQTGSADGHYITLSDNVDMANVDKMIFGKGDRVEFGMYDMIPSAKMGWSIKSCCAENLHGKIDVSMCHTADFSSCDLKDIEDLKTENVKFLVFKYAKNFFKEYHFKNNQRVDFKGIKFDKDAKISFENVNKVWFYENKFPKVLDLSGCDEVSLFHCDFSQVKEKNFKVGSKISIAGEVPDDFDFSYFSEVIISDCNLSNVKDLRFKNGAKVVITDSVECNKLLDVSNCGEVYFGAIPDKDSKEETLFDVPKIKKIKFEDEEQMKKSYIKRDYRKFVFAESVVGATVKKIASVFGGRDKD